MKTIVKFATAAVLVASAVAPALAYNPEAQLLAERSMSVIGQDQAYSAYAQDIAAPVVTVAPEAQLLTERNAYMPTVHTWAGTRRF